MADVLEPITLNSIDFEIKYPETSPEEYFSDFITPSTLFVELPQKFNDALAFETTYFTELFKDNTEELLNKVNELYNKQLELMKKNLESSLELNSDDLYDIHVTNSKLAENSSKFNGKSYNDTITDIMINHVTPATVKNALNFSGYSFSDLETYIKEKIKVDSASAADIAFGKDYSTLKNDILNSIESTTDYSGIQDKVEKEWTAFKAKTTDDFSGYSFSDLETYIKEKIKVDSASAADTAFGKTLDEFKKYITEEAQTEVSNLFSDDTSDTYKSLVKLITGTKVDNASNSDDSDKFSSKTEDEWIDKIKSTKVNNAVEADKADETTYFGGLTSSQWDDKFDELDTTLKNYIATEAVAYLADDVKNINGIEISKFDDHIKDLASDVVEGSSDSSINAATLEDRDTDELIDYLQTELIPDKATKATNAYYVYDIDNHEYKFTNDIVNNIIDDNSTGIFNSFANYIDNLDINDEDNLRNFRNFYRNNFDYLDSLYSLKIKAIDNEDELINYKTKKLDSFFLSTVKKNYTYNDDGVLIKEENYLLTTQKDDDGNDVDEYLLINEKNYEYNNDGVLVKNSFVDYFYDESSKDDDGNEISGYYKIYYSTSFTYDDNGNKIEEINSYDNDEFIKDDDSSDE